MDSVLLLMLISSLIGLLAQHYIKEESLNWLVVALSTGSLILTITSETLTNTEMTFLIIASFICWIYSILGLFKLWGMKS